MSGAGAMMGAGNFSRAICVDKFLAAVVDGGALCDEIKGAPSKNRWGSLQEHESEQVLGDFLHKIFPQACSRALGTWDNGDLGDMGNEDDDYRKMVRGKAYRTVCMTSDPVYQYKKACRNFFMSPMQHLWARLQHMDEEGNSITDVNYPPCNPILAAQKSVATMVFQPIRLGPLQTLFRQYHRDIDFHDGMITYTRTTVLSIDSQVLLNIYIYLCIYI